MRQALRAVSADNVVIPFTRPQGRHFAVSSKLHPLLAATHVLYLETLSCRWRASQPHLIGLHDMLEQQCDNLLSAGDAISDRLQSLGHFTPLPLNEFIGQVDTQQYGIPACDMLKSLVYANENCMKLSRQGLEAAERAEDSLSANLLAERAGAHAVAVNMLNSILAITLTFRRDYNDAVNC